MVVLDKEQLVCDNKQLIIDSAHTGLHPPHPPNPRSFLSTDAANKLAVSLILARLD